MVASIYSRLSIPLKENAWLGWIVSTVNPIFVNKDTTTYSMVFKLPDAMRQKGNIDLCIFNVGNELRPAMTQPKIETVF